MTKQETSARRRIKRASRRYSNGTKFESATGSKVMGIVKSGLKLKWINLDRKSTEEDIEEASTTNGDIVSIGGIGCVYSASTNKWGKIIK